MENEAKLRDALAFILSQKEITGYGARLIAHKALRELYGNDIPGETLEQCNAWMDEETERIAEDLKREAQEWAKTH